MVRRPAPRAREWAVLTPLIVLTQGCGASSDASSKYAADDAPPVPELTEEEKESMTKAFKALDKDGDGSLSKDEIRVRPIATGQYGAVSAERLSALPAVAGGTPCDESGH